MAKRIPLTSQERGELVLRLLRNEATASELAREHSISEPTLYQWRTSFLEGGVAGLRDGRRSNSDKQHQRELAKRDQVIGELTVALRVLKKNMALGVTQESRDLVNEERKAWKGRIRLVELLKHLGLSSSTWYRKANENPKPRGRPRETLDPSRVEAVRELCKKYPFRGYKRIAEIARREIAPDYSNHLVHRIMKECDLRSN